MLGDNLRKESLEKRLEPPKEICQRCDDADLHYPISQYFADTGETAETVKTKLDFLREIRPVVANQRVDVPIQPDTPVAHVALKEGLITDESD